MKKYITVFLISVFLLSFASCKKKYISLEGYIYEMYKNTPVTGIELIVGTLKTKTDDLGYYKIDKLIGNKFDVKINKTDRYTEFKDSIVLDQTQNSRDFVIEAKNPFNIKEDEISKPYTYHYSFFIGFSQDKPSTIAEVDSSTLDSALRIKGKEYSYIGNKENITNLEFVQIGTTCWVKDKYDLWNIVNSPGESLFRINKIFTEEYELAANFYKNPEIVYKETNVVEIIDGFKTKRFDATFTEKSSGFVDYLQIYAITEGRNTGIVKKIISNSKARSVYPYVKIVISRYDEDLKIVPPDITK